MQDIGNHLFSFTIPKDLEWSEFRGMGRSVRYMNTKKIMLIFIISVLVVVVLSLKVSMLFTLLFIAVGLEIVVFMEYSARAIGQKLREKAPIKYDFYEDGLVETDSNGPHTILYSKFRSIKVDSYAFTMVGKENDVVIVPRSQIDKDAEALMFKLAKILGGKKRGRRKE